MSAASLKKPTVASDRILGKDVTAPLGFRVLIASVKGTAPKHRFTGRHFDTGFFKTRRFAMQSARAGVQLGKGYVVMVSPNFFEPDKHGRIAIRHFVCFDGEGWVEYKTFMGVHTLTIMSIGRAQDKLVLPELPNAID